MKTIFDVYVNVHGVSDERINNLIRLLKSSGLNTGIRLKHEIIKEEYLIASSVLDEETDFCFEYSRPFEPWWNEVTLNTFEAMVKNYERPGYVPLNANEIAVSKWFNGLNKIKCTN